MRPSCARSWSTSWPRASTAARASRPTEHGMRRPPRAVLLLDAAASFLPAGSPPRTLLVDPALSLQDAVDRALPRASRGRTASRSTACFVCRSDARVFQGRRREGGGEPGPSRDVFFGFFLGFFSSFVPGSGGPQLAAGVVGKGDVARRRRRGGKGAELAREGGRGLAALRGRCRRDVSGRGRGQGRIEGQRGPARLAGLSGSSGGSGGPSVAYETAAEDERTRSAAEASSPYTNPAFASSFSSPPSRSKPVSAAPPPPPSRARPTATAATAKPAVAAAPRQTPPRPSSQPPVAVVNGASLSRSRP